MSSCMHVGVIVSNVYYSICFKGQFIAINHYIVITYVDLYCNNILK